MTNRRAMLVMTMVASLSTTAASQESATLAKRAQGGCSIEFFPLSPPEPSKVSGLEDFCRAHTTDEGAPPRCEAWPELDAGFAIWSVEINADGQYLVLLRQVGTTWEQIALIFYGWSTPGGGNIAELINAVVATEHGYRTLTIRLKSTGFDPDHGEPPQEMEDHVETTVVCAWRGEETPRCVSFATEIRGARFNLKRMPNNEFRRISRVEAWRMSSKYRLEPNGYLRIIKTRGPWAGLRDSFETGGASKNPAGIPECNSVFVRLWAEPPN